MWFATSLQVFSAGEKLNHMYFKRLFKKKNSIKFLYVKPIVTFSFLPGEKHIAGLVIMNKQNKIQSPA